MEPLAQPRDVGNGLVCASFGAGGEWLSLATVDPRLGFVELTGLPRFDEAQRGHSDAVRRYRSWMRQQEHAFLTVEAGLATVTTRQEAPRSTRRLTQHVLISALPGERPEAIHIRFSGRLARPAYGEITEVDPPRWETEPTRLEIGDAALRVFGEGPPIVVQAWLGSDAGGSPSDPPGGGLSWRLERRPEPAAEARFEWPADTSELRIDIACTFDLPVTPAPEKHATESAGALVRDEPGSGAGRPMLVPPHLLEPSRLISRRAVDYVRGCTALQVDAGERCILTDHRILPLSWTRDAYWQARLLLATWSREEGPGDDIIVSDHLRWLFIRCERPDGSWARSHYVDGTRKDRPFQADQQIYPILELTDFLEITGRLPELPPGSAWAALVATAWAAVEAAIDGETGLIRADENPADDALIYPFLLSNQILLWRVATRLAASAEKLGMTTGPFTDLATRTKAAVGEHLVIEGPMGPQWAYAVDARGGSELYHEANDLPVALAPLWRFCTTDDPRWRGTMRFAFDPANPGFVAGSQGGLGSRHTSGTWTLGDIQRWVAAGSSGDQDGSEAALERLIAVASLNDHMLPEAYDPEGSGTAVRHWFAWPGATFATLLLEHARAER